MSFLLTWNAKNLRFYGHFSETLTFPRHISHFRSCGESRTLLPIGSAATEFVLMLLLPAAIGTFVLVNLLCACLAMGVGFAAGVWFFGAKMAKPAEAGRKSRSKTCR